MKKIELTPEEVQKRAQEVLPHLDKHLAWIRKFHDKFMEIVEGKVEGQDAHRALGMLGAENISLYDPAELSSYLLGFKPLKDKQGYKLLHEMMSKVLTPNE